MSDIRCSLEELYQQYTDSFKNEQVVLGDGHTNSPLVLIGEAPGKDEIKQGKPFVGAAGKNLNEFISVLGISREELYITNVIKYRLGKLNEKTQKIINRPATKEDILINQKWLHREIEIIKPQLIVTLGNVPLKAITNDFSASIGSVHGSVINCILGDTCFKVFPLYHPASIIYNRALKETYNKDMILLKKYLEGIEKDF